MTYNVHLPTLLSSALLTVSACGPKTVIPHPGATPQPLSMERIIETPGVDGAELFDRARAWAVSTFIDSKEAIELVDEDDLVVMGKGWLRYASGKNIYTSASWYDGGVRYVFRLEFKDGRSRMLLDGFHHEGVARPPHPTAASCGPLHDPPKDAVDPLGIPQKAARRFCYDVVLKARTAATRLLDDYEAALTAEQTRESW